MCLSNLQENAFISCCFVLLVDALTFGSKEFPGRKGRDIAVVQLHCLLKVYAHMQQLVLCFLVTMGTGFKICAENGLRINRS